MRLQVFSEFSLFMDMFMFLIDAFMCLYLTKIFYVIQFLRCREAWLAGIIDDLDQRNAYDYLKWVVNCQRMHLFDVVNQYRAIFADDTSGSEENYDGGLLFSWAMHQIMSHLRTLNTMLPKITEGGSLSNILDQCMVRTLCFSFRACMYSPFFLELLMEIYVSALHHLLFFPQIIYGFCRNIVVWFTFLFNYES